jgi:hypothetical protein
LERQELQAPSTFFGKRDVGGVSACSPERLRRDMPPWLEVLLDVLGFAGFIGVATYMKSPAEKKQVDR